MLPIPTALKNCIQTLAHLLYAYFLNRSHSSSLSHSLFSLSLSVCVSLSFSLVLGQFLFYFFEERPQTHLINNLPEGGNNYFFLFSVFPLLLAVPSLGSMNFNCSSGASLSEAITLPQWRQQDWNTLIFQEIHGGSLVYGVYTGTFYMVLYATSFLCWQH